MLHYQERCMQVRQRRCFCHLVLQRNSWMQLLRVVMTYGSIVVFQMESLHLQKWARLKLMRQRHTLL